MGRSPSPEKPAEEPEADMHATVACGRCTSRLIGCSVCFEREPGQYTADGWRRATNVIQVQELSSQVPFYGSNNFDHRHGLSGVAYKRGIYHLPSGTYVLMCSALHVTFMADILVFFCFRSVKYIGEPYSETRCIRTCTNCTLNILYPRSTTVYAVLLRVHYHGGP